MARMEINLVYDIKMSLSDLYIGDRSMLKFSKIDKMCNALKIVARLA